MEMAGDLGRSWRRGNEHCTCQCGHLFNRSFEPIAFGAGSTSTLCSRLANLQRQRAGRACAAIMRGNVPCRPPVLAWRGRRPLRHAVILPVRARPVVLFPCFATDLCVWRQPVASAVRHVALTSVCSGPLSRQCQSRGSA